MRLGYGRALPSRVAASRGEVQRSLALFIHLTITECKSKLGLRLSVLQRTTHGSLFGPRRLLGLRSYRFRPWRILNRLRRLRVAYSLRFCFVLAWMVGWVVLLSTGWWWGRLRC